MVTVQYDKATKCTGGPTPGAIAIRDHWGTVTGLPNYGIYNCLAGETLVMTPYGDLPIRDLAGGEATILTVDDTGAQRSSKWVAAEIKSFGVQSLMAVTLSRNGVTRTVHATPGHRWITQYRRSGRDGGGHGRTEKTTTELSPGDVVPSAWHHSGSSRVRHMGAGIPHGLVFGDGTRDATGGTRISLCGSKNMALAEYFPNDVAGIYQRPADAEPYAVITGMSARWKELPHWEESSAYLYGFLAGWFAADGRVTESGTATLYNKSEEVLERARILARQVGINTYPVCKTKSGGNTVAGQWVEQTEMHSLTFVPNDLDSSFFLIPKHRERWNRDERRRPADWQVVDVTETDRVEEVYCAVVPGTENFALADNILTGNCRPVRGGSTKSVHSEGRAVDLGANAADPRMKALADHFARFLLWAAADLQVQYMIWNRRQIKPGGTWAAYNGASNHTDHIHAELNRAGAAKVTAELVQALWHQYVFTIEPQPAIIPISVPAPTPVAPVPARVTVVKPAAIPAPVNVALPRVALDDAGGPVTTLQAVLNAKSNAKLTVDGHLGPKTEYAVKNFQRFFKLSVDGVVGEKTWSLLLGL